MDKFRGEAFKEVHIHSTLKKRYAISNYGRFMSFYHDFSDGSILKCHKVNGFRIFKYKVKNQDGSIKNKHVMLYKLVAENFVPNDSLYHLHVIHLNYNTQDDHYSNLKWVSEDDKKKHNYNNPKRIKSFKALVEHNKKRDGLKLTSTHVLRIKKILNNPNRKYSISKLAKDFNVSTMQIYRIKNGENWQHLDQYITNNTL